jgi:hypothetical protein
LIVALIPLPAIQAREPVAKFPFLILAGLGDEVANLLPIA